MNLYCQEDIERAKKRRGRAFLCTSCYNKSERQVKKIDEKGRIEDHILKTHMTPERWPFYCIRVTDRQHSQAQNLRPCFSSYHHCCSAASCHSSGLTTGNCATSHLYSQHATMDASHLCA